MNFYTTIYNGKFTLIYSHTLEKCYVFPRIKPPKNIEPKEFFKTINESRASALREKRDFVVRQYQTEVNPQ